VALIALLLGWATGLMTLEEALSGFGSPAVLIVAAVLVVGRAVEYSGAAQAMADLFVPKVRFVSIRFAGILFMGMALSAFMNNIAALAITMPIALGIAREHKLPPSAVLMPLSFATILGGMTTLIGTPGNLIVSTVREDAVGAPFGMFDMTPAAGALAIAGILYLTLIGWRLAPRRAPDGGEGEGGVLAFELAPPMAAFQGKLRLAEVRRALRKAGGVLLGVMRDGARARLSADARLFHDDRLLVLSRDPPWEVASKAGLFAAVDADPPGSVAAHVSVGYGSSLVGEDYGAIAARTDGAVEFIAAGRRAARLRRPLETNLIQPGDELHLRGPAPAVAQFIRSARLIEIGRRATPGRPGRPALLVIGIYALAVVTAAIGVPTTAAFIVAALVICLAKLLPPDEAYRAIDIPVLILLAGMIPIGRAFNDAGGSEAVAAALGWSLQGAPLFVVLAAIIAVTMLLTVFLNNVATALVMAQVGLEAARGLGISPDAALIAVLIGSSCDFLTPIGTRTI
jgi:di/tricarboxylate transporter